MPIISPLRLVLGHPHVLRGLLRARVRQRLEVAQDHGEGRAQLVAHVGEVFLPLAVYSLFFAAFNVVMENLYLGLWVWLPLVLGLKLARD